MRTLNKKNYLSLNYSRHSKKARHAQSDLVKKIILSVIAIVAVIILGLTIFAAIFTNENRVKSAISSIATDYYENYFYEELLESSSFSKDNPGETLGKYQTSGLAILSLRDLLLHDDQKFVEDRKFLAQFCDEDQTFIHYYPDEPYARNSYHVEYTYSCNF